MLSNEQALVLEIGTPRVKTPEYVNNARILLWTIWLEGLLKFFNERRYWVSATRLQNTVLATSAMVDDVFGQVKPR